MPASEAGPGLGTRPAVPDRISPGLHPRTPRMLLSMRASARVRTMALLTALAACGGGGGGGAPLVNPAKLLVGGARLAAGETSGELEIGVASDGTGPVLVQLDLRTDPERVRLGADPIALQGEARSGPLGPGRYRLVLGDPRTAQEPRTLSTGTVARIPFELVGSGSPSVIEVWAEDVQAADAKGETAPIDAPGSPALIEIR